MADDGEERSKNPFAVRENGHFLHTASSRRWIFTVLIERTCTVRSRFNRLNLFEEPLDTDDVRPLLVSKAFLGGTSTDLRANVEILGSSTAASEVIACRWEPNWDSKTRFIFLHQASSTWQRKSRT
jgi:hypothetical protein